MIIDKTQVLYGYKTGATYYLGVILEIDNGKDWRISRAFECVDVRDESIGILRVDNLNSVEISRGLKQPLRGGGFWRSDRV